jgi:hypothetical protein
LKFYGIIFRDTSETFTNMGADDWQNEYYNCVFDTISMGGYNGRVAGASIKYVNCLFKDCTANVYWTNNPTSGELINCASTNTFFDNKNGTLTNCQTNMFNEWDFSIVANPNNVGVYKGAYAWDSDVRQSMIVIRIPTGGCAYSDGNGSYVLNSKDLGNGAYPENNEWDAYVVKSDLNGSIVPGDDDVWHWTMGVATMSQETIMTGSLNGDGSGVSNANLVRMIRGSLHSNDSNPDVNRCGFLAAGITTTSISFGFRPVAEYRE